VGSTDRPGADQYLQRAELLADLGRYEDAAGELADLVTLEPGHVPALTTLARVRLAAGQPAEAMVAADAAVAADPTDLRALVARGMVLTDLDRISDAADTAEQILRVGPDDGYAQTSAAAILAEVRNGQRALDAAWRGVQLVPEDATAHLVLGLVAARMRLFDLAERAYREALRLDPQLAAARDDVGIARLEQRRYAEALEQFVAGLTLYDTGWNPLDAPRIRADMARDPADAPRDPADMAREPADAAWGSSGAAGGRAAGYGLPQVLHVGAGYALIAPLIAACIGTEVPVWRVAAILLACCGFVGLGVFVTRLPGPVGEFLPPLLRADRRLAVATAAVVAAPCLILLYALVGSPWPLAAAIAAGAVALLTNIVGYRAR
jgi:tetratricopeptide (TPR) repeat protein